LRSPRYDDEAINLPGRCGGVAGGKAAGCQRRVAPRCAPPIAYQEDSDCEYDETLAEEWSEGPVGFKPAPVFDASHAAGERPSDLGMKPTGGLSSQLTDAANALGVTVQIIPAGEWTHGEAEGAREQLRLVETQPRVEVRDRDTDADIARILIHECAHVLPHFDVDENDTEQSKRDIKAEAGAYVVGWYRGLDTLTGPG